MTREDFLYEESMEMDIWLNENFLDVKMDLDVIDLMTESKEKDKEKSDNKFVKVAKRLAKMIGTLIEQLKKYLTKDHLVKYII